MDVRVRGKEKNFEFLDGFLAIALKANVSRRLRYLKYTDGLS